MNRSHNVSHNATAAEASKHEPMTMVVHSTAAATVDAELIVPVHRFPTLRGFLTAWSTVGAAKTKVNAASGRTTFEKYMASNSGLEGLSVIDAGELGEELAHLLSSSLRNKQ